MCRLCEIVRSRRYREYGEFVLVPECNKCGIPMLVYKLHDAELGAFARKEFDMLMEASFKGRRPRGIGMRSNKLHWHEHLVQKEEI